jgi:hypothetical protein
MNLINVLLGNSSVNMNTGNNRSETVFYAVHAKQKHRVIGSLLPANTAVNMHPQQWETVFSVDSVQRSYHKDEQCYKFSSEFSVQDSHEKFVIVAAIDSGGGRWQWGWWLEGFIRV